MMKTISTIIFLGFFLFASSKGKDSSKPWDAHLDRMGATSEQIEKRLQRLNNYVNQIVSIFSQILDASKKKSIEFEKKLYDGPASKDIELLYLKLLKEYPEFAYIFILIKNSDKKLTQNPSETTLKQLIADATKNLNKMSATNCFNSRSKTYIPKESCEETRKTYCSAFLSKNSQLFANKLDSDGLISEVLIDEKSAAELWTYPGDRLISKERWLEFGNLTFDFCSAIAKSGFPFKDDAFANYPDKDPKWADYTPIIFSEEDFTSKCNSNVLAAGEKNLAKLKPKYSDRFPVKQWAEKFEDRKKQCRDGAESLCSAVSFIKNTGIISYPTVACKIRDVTASDIRADLKSWKKMSSITEATILRHAQLLDRLELCINARKDGYSWYSIRPEVEKDCKPEN